MKLKGANCNGNKKKDGGETKDFFNEFWEKINRWLWNEGR